MVLCPSIPLQKFFLLHAVHIILNCPLNNFFWMTPYPFSTMSYASQENSKKPNNWAAFVWIQKSAPRKIYFFTDFIKTHLCTSLDGGIGKSHPSQTWRYQGPTVIRKDCSSLQSFDENKIPDVTWCVESSQCAGHFAEIDEAFEIVRCCSSGCIPAIRSIGVLFAADSKLGSFGVGNVFLFLPFRSTILEPNFHLDNEQNKKKWDHRKKCFLETRAFIKVQILALKQVGWSLDNVRSL